jgi:hypothetical protein
VQPKITVKGTSETPTELEQRLIVKWTKHWRRLVRWCVGEMYAHNLQIIVVLMPP